MSFENIVAAYIRDCRPAARADAECFRRLLSIRDAIKHAALCHWLGHGKKRHRPHDHKRHPHQWRIPGASLKQAARRLNFSHDRLAAAADFETLHRTIDEEIGGIRGIGPLAVYDIAHRIGAFLEKTPRLVYLHAGTRMGARLLGFRGPTLDPEHLPPAFTRLSAAEIEDCLCIYRSDLSGRLRHGMSTLCRNRVLSKPCVRAISGGC
jgi:hypothetical protein